MDAHLNGYFVGGQRNHMLGDARQPVLLIAQHSVYYGLVDQRAVQHSGYGGDISTKNVDQRAVQHSGYGGDISTKN
ncbi:hypothetical protein [Rickettsiella massiliensis]|uniref:hypothetical protein n=1 Tax=Rickettsiella massiliensis TaxID=676517 RepID=UPI0002FE8FDE|nr:hypothetical protein [Rickettsiella massiliensis]